MSPKPSLRSLENSHPMPMRKPREFSTPEDNPMQLMKSPKPPKATQPRYEQALAVVKEYVNERSERPLSFTLSPKDFIRITEELGYDKPDHNWPRYSFDASTSKMTIQCVPSPVHECVLFLFLKEFFRSTADLPDSLDSRIIVAGAEDTCGFSGRYAGSQKTPDLAIKFRDADGERTLKCVFEVGSAETYNDLVGEAQMWLEGWQSIALVVLVNIEETPPYKSPIQDLSETEFAQLKFSSPSTVKGSDFRSQGEYGPVTYQGLCWAGNIASMSVEIWRRDPVTGLARKDEDHFDLFTSTHFSLRLSDLFGASVQEYDRTISVSSEKLRSRMKEEIVALALSRYRQAWWKYSDAVDRDYEPDTSASSSD